MEVTDDGMLTDSTKEAERSILLGMDCVPSANETLLSFVAP